MLGPYTHRIDPILFDVGGVHLWWYGLGFALGFLELHLFLRRGRGQLRLSCREAWSLSLFVAFGVLVGGRAVEIAFDEWPFYRKHLHLLVALFATPAPTAGRSNPPDAVREPESGTPFPRVLIPPSGTEPQRLMGTGIRRRSIFRVNVYAFGLYVDPTGAEAALAGFAGRRATTLRRDERFHRRLLDLDFGMTLRLVMARTVEGREVADAFDDALRPRMTRARQSHGDADAAALARLRSHLEVEEVQRGTEIVLSCQPTGRLTTSVRQSRRAPIESRALCRALFDVYLGENPIERDGKRNMVAGIARLLAPAFGSEGSQP